MVRCRTDERFYCENNGNGASPAVGFPGVRRRGGHLRGQFAADGGRRRGVPRGVRAQRRSRRREFPGSVVRGVRRDSRSGGVARAFGADRGQLDDQEHQLHDHLCPAAAERGQRHDRSGTDRRGGQDLPHRAAADRDRERGRRLAGAAASAEGRTRRTRRQRTARRAAADRQGRHPAAGRRVEVVGL